MSTSPRIGILGCRRTHGAYSDSSSTQQAGYQLAAVERPESSLWVQMQGNLQGWEVWASRLWEV